MTERSAAAIVAEHHGEFDVHRLLFMCRCGVSWPALSDDYDTEVGLHAEHALSELAKSGFSVVQRPAALMSSHGDLYWPFETLGPVVHQKVVLHPGRVFLANSSIIRSPWVLRDFAAALLAAAVAIEES